MKRVMGIAVLMLTMGCAAGAATPPSVVGTWEGESVCQVPKPCTTEHVIYEITQQPDAKIKIKADKVVNGERQWMGDLDCSWAAPKLSCPMTTRKGKSLWLFTLNGDSLTGTLVMEEGNVLFRKIDVKRKTASK